MPQGNPNYSSRPYTAPVHSSQRRRGGYQMKKKHSGGGKAFLALLLVLILVVGLVALGAFIQKEGFLDFKAPQKEVSSELEIIDENEGVSSAPVRPGIEILPLEKVKCQSYIVIDKATGKTILENNSTEKIYPASTTKILTALVAAEQGTPDQKMTASQNAIESLPSDASVMGLKVGEETTLDELMYGLMLPSGCDAANVIAEELSGSISAFATAMNNKAETLGCTGSNFSNPSGLYEEELYTTSADLAKIAAAASRNEWYSRVVDANDHAYKKTNKHNFDGWAITSNSNRLLNKSYLFGQEGLITAVTGGKTGSHSQGGFNLVCTATTRGGTELVAVINNIAHDAGQGAPFLAPYMAALLNAAAKEVESGTVTTYLSTDQPIPGALIPLDLPERVVLLPERNFSAVDGVPLPTETAEETSSGVVVPDEELQRKISAGTITFTFTPDKQYALKIENLDPGEEKRVGYLSVTDSEGARLCADILVHAKFR